MFKPALHSIPALSAEVGRPAGRPTSALTNSRVLHFKIEFTIKNSMRAALLIAARGRAIPSVYPVVKG